MSRMSNRRCCNDSEMTNLYLRETFLPTVDNAQTEHLLD